MLSGFRSGRVRSGVMAGLVQVDGVGGGAHARNRGFACG